MTTIGWIQIVVFALVMFLITKPLGIYLFKVFEGPQPLPAVLGRIERLVLRLCGVDPKIEQTWKGYGFALLAFSLFGMLVTYFIQRLQHLLPLNPQHFAAVNPTPAFNPPPRFTTHTNLQSYPGESPIRLLPPRAGLALA